VQLGSLLRERVLRQALLERGVPAALPDFTAEEGTLEHMLPGQQFVKTAGL
jgi:hypothetical protein